LNFIYYRKNCFVGVISFYYKKLTLRCLTYEKRKGSAWPQLGCGSCFMLLYDIECLFEDCVTDNKYITSKSDLSFFPNELYTFKVCLLQALFIPDRKAMGDIEIVFVRLSFHPNVRHFCLEHISKSI
jgi:hypothetical protein